MPLAVEGAVGLGVEEAGDRADDVAEGVLGQLGVDGQSDGLVGGGFGSTRLLSGRTSFLTHVILDVLPNLNGTSCFI